MTTPKNLLLEVRNLKKSYPIRRGVWRQVAGHVHAVNGVSLTLQRGETLGLVGESGCGKTTLGRSILRLIEPTEGDIIFHHQGRAIDLRQQTPGEMRRLRREMQYVFQDPFSSLNPWINVFDIIAEPLVIHDVAHGSELRDRVEQLIQKVGLKPDHLRRYPYAFSGGQRQRIGIARALALNPSLIVADEPVSALDVSVQAQILNLLHDLQQELNLACLFVAHDLSVVEHISDRVAVMYLGEIVETAPAAELYGNPLHPYTRALLSAVPEPDPESARKRTLLRGEVPDPADTPTGCAFHPRCPHADATCSQTKPELREVTPGHWSRACGPCLGTLEARNDSQETQRKAGENTSKAQ